MLDVPVHSLLRLCRSSVVFNTVLCVCLRWMRVRTCAQGGEDGEVCLWSGGKKKPIASAAHAVEQVAEEDHECSNWVSAVACCRYSDLAASGAADGVVRLWKADKSLTAVGEVPIEGHVNGLQLSAGWSLPPPYPPSPVLSNDASKHPALAAGLLARIRMMLLGFVCALSMCRRIGAGGRDRPRAPSRTMVAYPESEECCPRGANRHG